MASINCILKHKDLNVAIIEVDIDFGFIRNSKILIPEHMPVSTTDTSSLSAWWMRRAVPETQDFLKDILAEISTNTYRLLTRNLGLSLNDAYWICPPRLDLRWKDINLYQNDFSYDPEHAGLEFAYDGSIINLDSVGSFFPGSSLQGNLKKRWIKKGKTTYLAKGNYRHPQQSLNERFATFLHQKQETTIPYVHYELAELEFQGEIELGCISENFTDTNLEFVSARDILYSNNCKTKEMQSPQQYIRCLVEMGMEEKTVRDGIWYLIITDYLMTNEDRHLNNYGILRDSDTLKPVCLAPIFDTGNSMFWEGNLPKDEEALKNIRINRAERKESILMNLVEEYDSVDVQKLPDSEEITGFYMKYQMSEEHAEALAKWFLHKKDSLLKNNRAVAKTLPS